MKEDAAGPGKLTTKNTKDTKDTKDTKKKDAEKVEFTSISLFSGAGGLDIGLEQAGFETYDRKQRWHQEDS